MLNTADIPVALNRYPEFLRIRWTRDDGSKFREGREAGGGEEATEVTVC